MKVIKEVFPRIEFCKLNPGDCFLYENVVAAKISPVKIAHGGINDEYNAIILNDGLGDISFLQIDDDFLCRELECTITIEQKNKTNS